jgi:hypothetical protein
MGLGKDITREKTVGEMGLITSTSARYKGHVINV